MRPDPRSEEPQSTRHDPDAGAPAHASRRAFLVRTGALAGVGALGVAGLSAGAAQASTTAAAEPDHDVPDGESIVAYVSDVASGEITVMSGDREISIHDAKLARALARKVR